MDDILFLRKKKINDSFFYEVYFFGAVKLVKVTKEKYDNCKLIAGSKLSLSDFEMSCYNEGYSTVVNLKLK